MTAPASLADLRTQILRLKGHRDARAAISVPVANYMASMGRPVTTVQVAQVIEVAVEIAMEFAFNRFAGVLRVTEAELLEAMATAPDFAPSTRAELMSQLAAHGARHRTRKREDCRYCGADFQARVQAREAAQEGK